ncbi:hypothetical protein PWT90_07552 [Aphanocladium album]|nr:hypothetical protein PWT90_07552 [Aphanocladium album]
MPSPSYANALAQSQGIDSSSGNYFDALPNEVFALIIDLVFEVSLDMSDLLKLNAAIVARVSYNLSPVNRRFNTFTKPYYYICIDVIVNKQSVISESQGQFSDDEQALWGLITPVVEGSNLLRCLHLRGAYRLPLPSVVEALRKCCYQSEELILDGQDLGYNEEILPAVPKQVMYLPEYGKAIFTKLRLLSFVSEQEELDYWPKKLVELRLEILGIPTIYDSTRNLGRHHETLTVVDLECFFALTNFDFSSLISLRELRLLYWVRFYECKPFTDDDGRRLMAPQLRRLTLALAPKVYSKHIYFDRVTEYDRKWLMELGEYVAEHGSRLRAVHIGHRPRLIFECDIEYQWPWPRSDIRHLLEEPDFVANVVEFCSLEISYSDPTMSQKVG